MRQERTERCVVINATSDRRKTDGAKKLNVNELLKRDGGGGGGWGGWGWGGGGSLKQNDCLKGNRRFKLAYK